MINFSGKIAIVTGGTRGIGKSIVMLLEKLGCYVIYTGTKAANDTIIKNGRYEQLDLSEIDSIHRFCKDVITNMSSIDILINNAGINIIESIDNIKDENWERILEVNLTGSMRLMREVAKVMKKNNRGGRILNISSIFGVISREKRSSYSASKAGLIGLTKASALDLAPYNILVNALCPGFTLTELTLSILSEEEMKLLSSEVPLGRFANVYEIAKVAIFLCSDLNTYITGQAILVDGGITIK
jgi:3-oxoacyl-[acyl-carrier protein] reductase